jgi:hypothetical protein
VHKDRRRGIGDPVARLDMRDIKDLERHFASIKMRTAPEHFLEKWLPVFRPKMPKIIDLESHFDSIKMRNALSDRLELAQLARVTRYLSVFYSTNQ